VHRLRRPVAQGSRVRVVEPRGVEVFEHRPAGEMTSTENFHYPLDVCGPLVRGSSVQSTLPLRYTLTNATLQAPPTAFARASIRLLAGACTRSLNRHDIVVAVCTLVSRKNVLHGLCKVGNGPFAIPNKRRPVHRGQSAGLERC